MPAGFSGQTFLDFVVPKIEKAVKYGKYANFKIIIDGAVSSEKIKELTKLGVDGFVLGTSALFGKEEECSSLVLRLREQ